MIRKNGKKLLAACLIASLSAAPLSVGMMSEKAVYAEAEATVSKQYECDAKGNPVDGAAGTSRYYKEEISGSQTVTISNKCKIQEIAIEVKNAGTDLKIVAIDASKGIDEQGYEWLSHCSIDLVDSNGTFMQEKNKSNKDQEYYLFTNLAAGNYKINVVQGLEPYGNDGLERLVQGDQKIEYTMTCVVDRQALPTPTPVASATPQPTETPTVTNDSTGGANKPAPSASKKSSVKNKKNQKKLSVKGLTVKKNSKKITGTTMAKAKVKVKVDGKNYQTKANKKGKFSINLKKKLKKNAKIKIRITLKNYKSYTKTIKVK